MGKYVPSVGKKHSHRLGSFKRIRGRRIRPQQPNTVQKLVYRSNPDYYERREAPESDPDNPFVEEVSTDDS